MPVLHKWKLMPLVRGRQEMNTNFGGEDLESRFGPRIRLNESFKMDLTLRGLGYDNEGGWN
jgi:hypothetical protein